MIDDWSKYDLGGWCKCQHRESHHEKDGPCGGSYLTEKGFLKCDCPKYEAEKK